jgi:predicted nucleic-acid-binding Zn-ribbon protein
MHPTMKILLLLSIVLFATICNSEREAHKCPKCGSLNVELGNGHSCTLSMCPRFRDEHGNRIINECNTCYTTIHCMDCGHASEYQYKSV